MNIGIDARMYGPRQTGIGNYVKYLIEYLSRVDKENTYYIFFRKEEFIKCQMSNVKCQKVLADYPWYSLKEQTLFLRKLLHYPLHLLHFPHFNVPLLYPKPFIVTIHDLTPKFFPGKKPESSWIRRKAYDTVLKNAIQRSKSIITPSKATKDDILKYFAVRPDKVHVIYEGIPNLISNVSFRSLRNSEAQCQMLNVKEFVPYILYVGVWRYHKNLQGLLKAFALLKKRGLSHRLVIAGDPGKYYDQIKQCWESLNLSKNVIPLGFINENQLLCLYKNAQLLVVPSFYEGFGLVPLEALSVGTPVACSHIPALKETLQDAAFFFDPKDIKDMAYVIKKALFDKGARLKKEAEAKGLLQRYGWKENAKKTLQLYTKVFSAK